LYLSEVLPEDNRFIPENNHIIQENSRIMPGINQMISENRKSKRDADLYDAASLKYLIHSIKTS